MGAAITKPFAWLMRNLYELTSNYGLSVIFFALVVNLILTPFMAKSKKSMMRSTRLQPQIMELQKRHEGNPEKLNIEMQKLYREEGINPMSGCLWSLIPFPILIALYSVIRQPLTRMMYVAESVVDTLKTYFATQLSVLSARDQAYIEIHIANLVHQNWGAVQADLAGKIDKLMDLDFSFLGLNLGDQPRWNFLWHTDWSDPSIWLPGLGLFLIPFISALLSWVSMKVGNLANPPQQNADQSQAASMKVMNLMMPLMSVWICFVMPAAMGIYWIANSIFGMARDFILTKVYGKKLEKEYAEKDAARKAREKEIEERRIETERLRAEGKTEKNTNTSKKKIQANEKQKNDERRAAAERAERAERRERLGIKETEKPASQVGNRRYARGRAYVPDRYTNPDEAEAATAAAAAESEFAEAIDDSVEDDVTVSEAPVSVEETAEETADENSGSEEAPAPAEAAEKAEDVPGDEQNKQENN